MKAVAQGDKRLLLYEPPVRLQRKDGDPLFLSIAQTYLITSLTTGQYKARTTSYSYSLLVKKADDFEVILEFHWHPEHTRNLKWPHVHINGNTPEGELKRKHFPTARLSIEDFIRFLVRDFGIKPRMEHDEWKAILTRNKAAFVDHASWLHWKPLI